MSDEEESVSEPLYVSCGCFLLILIVVITFCAVVLKNNRVF